MIELYSGTPGSGKSVHLAKEIRSRLKTSRCVIIGNFYIDAVSIKKKKGIYLMVENYRLTPERLLSFARKYTKYKKRRLREGEILLIIDEAQLLFNAREWQSLGRKGWLSFFTQHRHYGYDVILAAQFDRMLDRNVRCLIEYDNIHRKVSRAGNIGLVVGLLFGGNLFICIRQWYPIHEKTDSHFFLGTKTLYALYDSYSHFDDIETAKAQAAEKKKQQQIAARQAASSIGPVQEETSPAPQAEPEAVSNVILESEIIKTAVPEAEKKQNVLQIFSRRRLGQKKRNTKSVV